MRTHKLEVLVTWLAFGNVCGISTPKLTRTMDQVFGRDGKQCVTSLDFNEGWSYACKERFLVSGMADYDNDWTPVLEVYKQQHSWPVLKPVEPKSYLRFCIPKSLLFAIGLLSLPACHGSKMSEVEDIRLTSPPSNPQGLQVVSV